MLAKHLQMVYEDLRWFDDVLSLVIPNLVLDPYIENLLNVDFYMHEELLDLQSNEQITPRMERSNDYF
uniref:Bestrophin homolog n=1 Tax=Trichuris muris TaxID=70415 RepID=A0A5S6QKR6_TRIMR